MNQSRICPTCGQRVPTERELAEEADQRLWQLEQVGTYRRALERIADAESGIWGRIAHEALTEGRPS
jgi:DNA repair exonuclease SbcCD ATPase subunit